MELFGRGDALRQLRTALPAGSAFVRGESGMGKTALLRAAVQDAAGTLGWGTCVASGASGYWPWTQALTGLVRGVGLEAARAAAGTDRGLLAALVPLLGEAHEGTQTDRDRLLLQDATVAWLEALAELQPIVLVLDDLQWADASSLALLEELVSRPRRAPVALLGAFRSEEATPALDRATSLGEHLVLPGLDRDAVAQLVRSVVPDAGDELVERVHARGGGHPLFTRELALADHHGALPAAVRHAAAQRFEALTPGTQQVLTTAAVIGNTLLVDVLTAVHGDRGLVDRAVDEGMRTALLQRGEGVRFAHDVFREAVVEQRPVGPALHAAVAEALAGRADRGGEVAAAEVARHLRLALPAADLADAVRWSMRAADDDRRALALEEAAAHLRMLRGAVAEAGLVLPDGPLCDVLLYEADLLARTGRLPDARGLVRAARDAADRAADGVRIAGAALAAASLGARFAARRDELVEELESALTAVGPSYPDLTAHLTAVLARELAHSVPEQRSRSEPLTEQAIALARGCDDPTVLRACLLARHDVLWSPGGGAQRVPVIDELIALARRCGSPDWLAEALVLQANALLESGSAAFSAVLHEALTVLAGLDEPRHAYTALTRRACLALLRGELADAERLIDEATALGGRLREPDTANVRMSQRLELVRARSDPAELQSFAAEAVAHWTGAPVHAHAVAAGFQARAADLEAARHHVSVVQELGTWRSDRSYLWSVFVRELATAAIALDDAPLMQQLLSDVRPLRGTCGVNGAAVAFAGCHSRVAAELAAALGDPDAAALLAEAQQVEARVGAAPRRAPTSLHREGAAWRVTWEGRTATVPHCKGLLDLAELLRRPREDVHVLDLMQAGAVAPDAGPALDRTAAQGYRRRLEELAAERASAERAGDAERVAAVDDETAVLAAELGRSSGLAGRPRPLGSSTTERARKAVTARIRDAVQRIDAVLPDLAAHLSHEVVTGVRCRYAGDRRWDVST